MNNTISPARSTVSCRRITGTRSRLPAILLLSLLLGAVAVADEPVVTVNGDSLTESMLMELITETHQHQSADEKVNYDYHLLLKKLVNDRLLLQDAYALGMEEELAGEMEEYRRSVARNLYIKESFQPELQVSDEEIEQVFREMYFRMQIRTVSIGSYEEAEQLIELVRQGASMDSLARAISWDTRRFQEGLHSNKVWADIINEFRDVAREMNVGDISAPFPIQDAHTFLRVEKRTEANPLELHLHSGRIRRDLIHEKREQAWRVFLDSLAQQFPLQVDSTVLNSVRGDSLNLFTPGFMQGSDRPVFFYDDDFVLSEDELRRDISYNAMQEAEAPFQVHVAQATGKLSESLVLLCAARADGYLDAEQVIEWYSDELDERLLNYYLEEMIASRIVFNRAEFDQYYREHEADFREPDEVRLEELHVHSGELATEVQSRLEEGAEFRYLSNLYQDEDEPGLVSAEWTPLSSFPDRIQQELEPLGTGGYCGPFSLEESWLFLSVKSRRPGKLKEMAEVEPKIKQVMFQLKFNELLDAHLELLKENSEIIYFEETIEDLLGNE